MASSSRGAGGRLPRITLSGTQLDALARLADEPGILPLLQRARLSRNLAFLAALLRELPSDAVGRTVRSGFEVLTAVQRRHPDIARDMLQHPRFGAWVAVCAAAVDTAGAGMRETPDVAAYLTGFAAAAAVRARMPFDLEVPQAGDAVVLPGAGCWTGRAEPGARVVHDGSAIPELEGRRWNSLRHLSAPGQSGTLTVEFDDLPPTPSAWPDAVPFGPDDRWTPWPDGEFRSWQERFDAAMRLLGAAVPELAEPLRRGIRAVLPRSREQWPFVSSTLVDSFGAAAMVLPADTLGTATVLLHEFQHSKLSVLMDLVPLITTDAAADMTSPWRAEPRPGSAILHGIYAHVAVVRLRRRVQDLGGRDEVLDIDGVRDQSLTACDTLLRSDRLTAAGRHFVELMQHTVIQDTDGRSAATPVRME